MSTPYHSQYYAYELTTRLTSDNADKLSQSLLNATVDLNPHQIEAARWSNQSNLGTCSLSDGRWFDMPRQSTCPSSDRTPGTWNGKPSLRPFPAAKRAMQAFFSDKSRRKAGESTRFKPILALSGLAFPEWAAIISATHSPCPSCFAVTHIKGEFFYCPDRNRGQSHRSSGLSRKERT
jgi:hypothetical protein